MPPLPLAAAVQAEVSAIDPDQPIFDLSTMEHLAASTMNRERFIIVLLGTFAGLAIVLAATGLYAVISYDVSRRTHEIGVRMALGANAGAVQRMVVRQGVRLALAGLAAGLVASIIASRLATSLVSGVRPLDPATYVAVAALLVIVAVWRAGCPRDGPLASNPPWPYARNDGSQPGDLVFSRFLPRRAPELCKPEPVSETHSLPSR